MGGGDPKMYEASFGNPVYEMHPDFTTPDYDDCTLPLKDLNSMPAQKQVDVETGLTNSQNGEVFY